MFDCLWLHKPAQILLPPPPPVSDVWVSGVCYGDHQYPAQHPSSLLAPDLALEKVTRAWHHELLPTSPWSRVTTDIGNKYHNKCQPPSLFTSVGGTQPPVKWDINWPTNWHIASPNSLSWLIDTLIFLYVLTNSSYICQFSCQSI